MQIGVIGVGLMGSAIMKRVGASIGWDVDPARCLNAIKIEDVFNQCDAIFLCLPDSRVVNDVLQNAPLRTNQYIIDTSTGDPDTVKQIGQSLRDRGARYVEATVSGSSAQVLNGDVLVMVGGSRDDFDACQPLLNRFARETIFTGECGTATKLKLVTNLVLGLNRAALAEGLAFAEQLHLEGALTLEVLRKSMAASRIMDTKGMKMVQRDFEPQAKLAQHLKDVRLMLESTSHPLPLTQTHRQLLELAVERGLGELDNSALLKVLLEP